MSTSDAELAKLRAQAAKAAAEAAQAKAEAAQAELDAALAASSGESVSPQTDAVSPQAALPAQNEESQSRPQAETEPPPEKTPSDVAEQPDAHPQDLSEYAATIDQAYAFDTPALTLGTFLEAGEPEPRSLVRMPLGMFNRHGLVAGATGTGKTRTLQLLAEGLSAAGIPVFLTDIKGDLTGLLEAGQASEKLSARVAALGQAWQPAAFPVELFSLGGSGDGVPVRTSVTDFGPILMAKVLGLKHRNPRFL